MRLIVTEGGARKSFAVPKDTACQHSPVFRAVFSKRSSPGMSQQYIFDPSVTYHTVSMLVQWLYTGGFSPSVELHLYPDDKPCRLHLALAQFYLLAEILKIDKLLSPILEKIQQTPITWELVADGERIFPYVYCATKPGSELRNAFVKLYLRDLEKDTISGPDREDMKNFPREVLADLVMELMFSKRGVRLQSEEEDSEDQSM